MARFRGQQPSACTEMSRGSRSINPAAYRSLRPFPGDGAAVPHRQGDVIRRLPAELLQNLQGDSLFALGEVGVDGGVAVVPAPAVDGGPGQLKGVLIGALHADDRGAEDPQLGHLAPGGAAGHKDVGGQPGRRRIARQGGGGVAGGGAGNGVRPRLPGLDDRQGGGPVLEGGRRILAVVLEVEGIQPQGPGQPVGLIERGPAHPQGRGDGLLLHRQKGPVPPHAVVAAVRQRFGGEVPPDGGVVVYDVQDAPTGTGSQTGRGGVLPPAFDALGAQDIFHKIPLSDVGRRADEGISPYTL